MGNPVPTTLRMRKPDNNGGGVIGTLRNLTKFIKQLDDVTGVSLDYIRGGHSVLRILDDIYRMPQPPKAEGGNATDLVGQQLPPGRERDARRPQPTVGGGIKRPGPQVVIEGDKLRLKQPSGISVRLNEVRLLPDFKTLTLFGEAKATVEIPTEYPAKFDSPTEIALKITSTSVSPSQIGLMGRATIYKVLHGDFKLQLHFNDRQLVDAVVRFAKQRNLTRPQVEQLLQSVSFDASAVVKAGLPISYLKLSASSILPLRRPVIGATEELLPIQLSSLPDREMFIGGAQVVPKGVFFDVPVPALGVHYSKYSRRQGISGTVAGLAKPDLNHLGQVQTFGYVDLHYARRMTNTVDLDVGVTYTYSPSSAAGEAEALQVQHLHARSKSWMPQSRDNEPPGTDRSGHNFMFTLKGTFDLL
jgi:hypothetical protein